MICWETLAPGIHVNATWKIHPNKHRCRPSSPSHDNGTPCWQWQQIGQTLNVAGDCCAVIVLSVESGDWSFDPKICNCSIEVNNGYHSCLVDSFSGLMQFRALKHPLIVCLEHWWKMSSTPVRVTGVLPAALWSWRWPPLGQISPHWCNCTAWPVHTPPPCPDSPCYRIYPWDGRASMSTGRDKESYK